MTASLLTETSRKFSKGGRGCNVEWSGNGGISQKSPLGNLGSAGASKDP